MFSWKHEARYVRRINYPNASVAKGHAKKNKDWYRYNSCQWSTPVHSQNTCSSNFSPRPAAAIYHLLTIFSRPPRGCSFSTPFFSSARTVTANFNHWHRHSRRLAIVKHILTWITMPSSYNLNLSYKVVFHDLERRNTLNIVHIIQHINWYHNSTYAVEWPFIVCQC